MEHCSKKYFNKMAAANVFSIRHIFDSSAELAREVDMKCRFIGWFVVCLIIPTMLLAQPAGKKAIVGVWEVKMAPVGQSQSPLLSLAMYGSDGSFITCGGYKTLPPIPAVQEVATEASPGYGRWAATGDREIRLTFYAIIWKEGLGNGYQRVQETLAMSEPGDEYTGHAQVDFLDANWNVVFSTTSDVKGTRLETPAKLMVQPAEKKQLVGVWEVKVSPVGQSPELRLAMYGDDGSVTTGGRYKALPPGSAIQDVADELGPGYGRWAATSDREFRLTFYSVMWKAGLVNGYQRVQETLDLPKSGDQCTGQAQVDYLDANWKIVFSTSSEVKGTRLETPAMPIAQPAQEKQLTGVWAIRNKTPGVERTLLNIDSDRADGSFTGISDKTIHMGNARTAGLRVGRCVATGTREFQLTFYAVTWNKEGVVDLIERVQATRTLSESGDEVTTHTQWAWLDLNWTVVFRGTADVEGTRLETPDQE
jgi:hypothetical protein